MQSPYNSEQITIWLRGLLTLAWSDGHFDEEEKALITALTQSELTPAIDLGQAEPIVPQDLAQVLEPGSQMAENFLRTAVMVAIADGVYSQAEDDLLQQFCDVLGHPRSILEPLRLTLVGQPTAASTAPTQPSNDSSSPALPHLDPLHPFKVWLDDLEIHDPRLARFLCRLVPPQCPFERDIKLFGHKIVHIPPLCKLNPLYEQLVGLRFRALSYLAEDCQEDVSQYI